MVDFENAQLDLFGAYSRHVFLNGDRDINHDVGCPFHHFGRFFIFNPLTHGLFEVHYLTACGLNRPQICGRISPQP
jgi:hypothetical protein